MSKLLFFLTLGTIILLLVTKCSFGQLSKRQFVYNTAKSKAWGYLYQPTDRSKKYPTIIFFHSGSYGGSTSTDADKLLLFGPLKFVKDGSLTPNYNILALQASSWTFSATGMMGALKSDTELVKIIDTSKIIITGIGAGGSEMSNWLSLKYPAKAAIFCSPVDPVAFSRSDVSVWLFSEIDDRSDVKTTIATLKTYSVNARSTTYPGTFCCWNTVYNPTWKENGKSMYEWIDSLIIPIPSPLILEAILIYADATKALKIDEKGKVILDGIDNHVIEYRLSTGEIIKPNSRFIWIFNFENNVPPFPLPN